MTIMEAIGQADALKPNQYTTEQKVAWLNELDTTIYFDVVRSVMLYDEWEEPAEDEDYYDTGDRVTFENVPYESLVDDNDESPEDAPDDWEEVTFSGYDSSTDLATELLAPRTYCDVYPNYLMMKIDLYNREIGNYNNSRILFNEAMGKLERFMNRAYMPCAGATHISL